MEQGIKTGQSKETHKQTTPGQSTKTDRSIIEYMKGELGIGRPDPRTYSPLALAYLGDSVYELLIRTMLVSRGNAPVQKYHKRASAIVNARAQADAIFLLEPFLTEEERAIYRRGKNANPATMAKNATAKEYRMATGLEAVLGYLYLTDQHERLIDLVKQGLSLRDGLEGQGGTRDE